MRLAKLVLAGIIFSGLVGEAVATDLPNRKAPPAFVPPPPVFTWTGLYVGGQLGYQWGTSRTAFLPNYSPSGVVGGAHIGYNLQIAQFVFGLEGDIDGSSYHGSNTAFGLTYRTRENVSGSIRDRFGIAFDRALIYATGGVAFADIDNSYAGIGISKTRVGWTAGGGIEYALDNNWSIRGEYRYTDYGYYTDVPVPGAAFDKHETDNKVEVGFSYKFGVPPFPLAAKY